MKSKGKNHKMVQQGNNFIAVALQLFLGETIVDTAKHEDDSVFFVTYSGDSGVMIPNHQGNLDIWIGEEVVYEIESDLYEVIHHKKDENLIELYDYIRTINSDQLKYKSRKFLKVVQLATENVLLNHTLPLTGQVMINTQEVIYKNNKKIKINLN